MEKKLIIFDFDGTIADTLPVFSEILDILAQKYSFKNYNPKNKQALRSKSAQELMKEAGVSWWKMIFLARDAKKELNKRISETKIIVGMKDTVVSLKKKGYVILILTSNSKKNVEQFLKQNELNNYIDRMYADVGLFSKTKKIEKAIKDYKCNKKNVVYVGDELRDIESSRKAGIKIISVSWGLNSKERLEKENPGCVCDTLLELEKMLHAQSYTNE